MYEGDGDAELLWLVELHEDRDIRGLFVLLIDILTTGVLETDAELL